MQENFEIHSWRDEKLPFIYHLDRVNERNGNHSNWHENIEILYVIEGSGTVLCDSIQYDAQVGDIFIINSENVHSISTERKIVYHCLIVDMNFCIENGIDAKHLIYEARTQDEKLEALFSLFIDEYEKDQGDFRIAAVRSAVLQIMLHISRYHISQKSERTSKSSNTMIRSALNFINAKYAESIDLDTISKNVNMSKFYFEREFKKYTGYSVITYLNILRCRKAKSLLKHSDSSISEIARACGFESASYFSKTFLKYIGKLPSQYRREH